MKRNEEVDLVFVIPQHFLQLHRMQLFLSDHRTRVLFDVDASILNLIEKLLVEI